MKVLLAEDEETIAITLRDALEDAGHDVLHGADTDAALGILEESNPDVVLTDILPLPPINLAEEDGWDEYPDDDVLSTSSPPSWKMYNHGGKRMSKRRKKPAALPLGKLEDAKGKPNRHLVADYCYWFWNWRIHT